MPKFDLIAAMIADGITVDKYGYMEDHQFFYRLTGGGDVQVGVRETFDRWANSVDFVFAIPRCAKSYRRTMDRLREFGVPGRYYPNWGDEVWISAGRGAPDLENSAKGSKGEPKPCRRADSAKMRRMTGKGVGR